MSGWEGFLTIVVALIVTDVALRGLRRFCTNPTSGTWWIPLLVVAACFWIAYAIWLVPGIVEWLEGA